MKIYNFIKNAAIATLLSAVVLAGCTSPEEEEAQRLFRPVNLKMSTSENSVSASWAGMTGATGYYVELYVGQSVKDDDGVSHVNKILVASDENLKGTSWTVGELDFETTYYFRVKANNADPTYNSRFSGFSSIKTPSEIQIISAVVDADLGSVVLNWMSGYNLTYIVLTDKDGEETVIDIDDAAGSYTLNNLPAGNYSATIYSDSRAYNTCPFEIPILKKMADADRSFGQVIFRWVDLPDLSHIVVKAVNPASDPVQHRYSILGNSKLFLEVTDLQPTTGYTATIYFENDIPGNTITFGTMSDAPANLIVVKNAQELRDTVGKVSSGSIIALEDGEYHVVDSKGADANLEINRTLTITSATGARPTIICKGIVLKNTVVVDSVRIENVIWNANKISGSYLFDYNTTANIGKLALENCQVLNLENSVLRCDRAGAGMTSGVQNVWINNCEIYNLGAKQCFIAYHDRANFSPASITIQNSTIVKTSFQGSQRFLYLPGNDNLRVRMVNNTISWFNYTATGSNYLIHYRAVADGSTTHGRITIKDNIIHLANHNKTTYVKNPNFGTATTDIADNNLYVPFVVSVSGDVLTDDTWSSYSTDTSDPNFVNFPATLPDDGDLRDFKIGSQTLVNKTGDPRWW